VITSIDSQHESRHAPDGSLCRTLKVRVGGCLGVQGLREAAEQRLRQMLKGCRVPTGWERQMVAGSATDAPGSYEIRREFIDREVI
jgi:hypothetical protein